MNLNKNKTLSEKIFLRPWPVLYLVFSIYTSVNVYVCGYEYTYMWQFLVIFPHFMCGKGSDISGDCNCQNIPQHSRVHRLGLEFDWERQSQTGIWSNSFKTGLNIIRSDFDKIFWLQKENCKSKEIQKDSRDFVKAWPRKITTGRFSSMSDNMIHICFCFYRVLHLSFSYRIFAGLSFERSYASFCIRDRRGG